ncbi:MULTISPECIES: hypothetical protein [unclassified Microcoleus]|uniref:hypothetical protein n=2 Tax=unclassified Microcoleus TaxID=2642155 RepID=UPI002FD30B1B
MLSFLQLAIVRGFTVTNHQTYPKLLVKAMLQDSSSNQTSPNVLTNQTFEADREAVRHVIIGSPLGVRRTIHQLHALRYEEAVRWTHPIAIPDNRIIITPEQGEIMSLLVKLIRLQ